LFVCECIMPSIMPSYIPHFLLTPSKNLTLAISDRPSQNVFYYISVASLVCHFVIFLFTLFCCCCRRKRSDDEFYAGGTVREPLLADGGVGNPTVIIKKGKWVNWFRAFFFISVFCNCLMGGSYFVVYYSTSNSVIMLACSVIFWNYVISCPVLISACLVMIAPYFDFIRSVDAVVNGRSNPISTGKMSWLMRIIIIISSFFLLLTILPFLGLMYLLFLAPANPNNLDNVDNLSSLSVHISLFEYFIVSLLFLFSAIAMIVSCHKLSGVSSVTKTLVHNIVVAFGVSLCFLVRVAQFLYYIFSPKIPYHVGTEYVSAHFCLEFSYFSDVAACFLLGSLLLEQKPVKCTGSDDDAFSVDMGYLRDIAA